MDVFSIAQMSKFSGIKAHTIRMWEQRYNSLHPHRSEGNTRYYDNSQLRRLLNLVSLMQNDFSISELSSLPDETLFAMVKKSIPTAADELHEYYISQLIAAGISYDEVHFDKIFSHCLLKLGMIPLYTRVIQPMLQRVGLMWSANALPPAHEHFISNLLKQKFFTAIDSLPPPQKAGATWLLFTPEDEFHELGLLFASYLIRLSGRKTFYLGANVPVSSVSTAVNATGASTLLLFMVNNDLPENIQAYLKDLTHQIHQKKIYVAGDIQLLEQAKPLKGVNWLHQPEDLQNCLA